jgi:hypothetical protein
MPCKLSVGLGAKLELMSFATSARSCVYFKTPAAPGLVPTPSWILQSDKRPECHETVPVKGSSGGIYSTNQIVSDAMEPPGESSKQSHLNQCVHSSAIETGRCARHESASCLKGALPTFSILSVTLVMILSMSPSPRLLSGSLAVMSVQWVDTG